MLSVTYSTRFYLASQHETLSFCHRHRHFVTRVEAAGPKFALVGSIYWFRGNKVDGNGEDSFYYVLCTTYAKGKCLLFMRAFLFQNIRRVLDEISYQFLYSRSGWTNLWSFSFQYNFCVMILRLMFIGRLFKYI
jgi:hypothetical protein